MERSAVRTLYNGYAGASLVQPVGDATGILGVWAVDFDVYTLARSMKILQGREPNGQASRTLFLTLPLGVYFRWHTGHALRGRP